MKTIKKSAKCVGKLVQRFLAIAVVIIMLCSVSLTALAAADSPSLDWSMSGDSSIMVEIKDEDGEMVTDGSLTIYQVALLEQNNGDMVYSFTSDFSGCGLSLGNVTADSTTLASKLAAYVSANHITSTSKTNTNGTVVFDNLELGLYLIVQTTESAGYYTMNPFVVSVPLDVNDTWVYNVDASPKVGVLAPQPEEPEPEEPETPELETPEPETPVTTTTLPQTGQLNWPVPVLAVCGLLLIGLGSVLLFSDRRKADVR